MNQTGSVRTLAASETLEGFYKRKPDLVPVDGIKGDPLAGHFNVYARDFCGITPYSRRDFYKVSLIIGTGTLHFADRWIEIDRPAILVSNPLVPYSWEPKSELQKGWFCIFSESFMGQETNDFLHQAPIFNIGSTPVCFLDEEAEQTVSSLFQKMVVEIQSDYAFKYNVLRNYVQLIIHEAMKLRPADKDFRRHTNASSRITELFIELLERQFPIDSPESNLKLRTANDFATNLSVHVNHLNRSVKECTGKTTSNHIAARIAIEARALLAHTDWDIAEIAYALGFEYPSYFTNFFRKQTGEAPIMIRQAALAARQQAI